MIQEGGCPFSLFVFVGQGRGQLRQISRGALKGIVTPGLSGSPYLIFRNFDISSVASWTVPGNNPNLRVPIPE